MILCAIFHDWWDARHCVQMRDCGMRQSLFCRVYRGWRHR